MRLYAVLLCCITLNVLAPAPLFGVELPEVFADHAVFQREQAVPVWGTGKLGEKISVSFAGQRHSAKADADGLWRFDLKAMKVNAKGKELVVVGDNTLRVKDILIGEVWLCSGQSNMGTAGTTVSWSRTREIIPESPNPLARVYSSVKPVGVAGGAIFTGSDNQVLLPNCYNSDDLPLVAFYEEF
ncbi:hypothetical protein ACFLS1_01830 [Verrucomicrobiota bacterium]